MGYRVVIGDDESIIRMDLRELLEEAGHEVVGEASDGVEAIELVQKEKPDIVLLDIKMPRLDGIHAAKMIVHDNLAPVLLLTAYSQQVTENGVAFHSAEYSASRASVSSSIVTLFTSRTNSPQI